jgi:hypothetical protein
MWRIFFVFVDDRNIIWDGTKVYLLHECLVTDKSVLQLIVVCSAVHTVRVTIYIAQSALILSTNMT